MDCTTEVGKGRQVPSKRRSSAAVEGGPRSRGVASTAERSDALGSIVKSSPPSPAKSEKAGRARGYQALSQAREWLKFIAKKNPAKAFGWDVHPTSMCRYSRVGTFVSVHLENQHNSAFYGGLATCASVWACPVCTAKIQARRRPELEKLVEWAYANGYEVQMVTFTFPHYGYQRLAHLLASQREAFKLMRKGKQWDKFKSGHGYQGMVRSLEITHGSNGFHPHTHELWITDKLDEIDQGDFKAAVLKHWRSACIRSGLLLDDPSTLDAFNKHAVDVQFRTSSSDYLAKQDQSRAWGIDAEMTAAQSKQGKKSGVHPHDFLVRQEEGDKELYLEYVQAMKGYRQLFWSPGLKDKAGVREVSDEQLVQEQTETADLLGLLTVRQWALIRGNDARAELLDAAECSGWQGVVNLLRSLGCDDAIYVPDPCS